MNTKSMDHRGCGVAAKLKKYWGSIGVRMIYNEISIDIKGADLPLAIISAYNINTFTNHPVMPDHYYKSSQKLWKAQFRLSRFYLNIPVHSIGGIKVYTADENLPLYTKAVSNIPGLKKVLSGYNASFVPIIKVEGKNIIFYKIGSFLQDIFGLFLPEKQTIEVADTLIDLAEGIR